MHAPQGRKQLWRLTIQQTEKMSLVFSFSLWGNKPLYTHGMIENVLLINKEFPDAFVWIYSSVDVPEPIRSALEKHPKVRLIPVESRSGTINTFYRFLAIDEPSVSCMIVRDADSRVNARDASAIRQFLANEKLFHIVRDHWGGHRWKLCAGMWGMKKGCLPSGVRMIDLVNAYGSIQQIDSYGIDQHFLQDILYPACVHNAMIHDGYGFFEPPKMRTPFLTERSSSNFIGRRQEVTNPTQTQ